jgi:hypothetical protein
MLALAIALGSVMMISACDTATDPIIGRMPPRPDTTVDSFAPRISVKHGLATANSQRAMPAKLAAAIRPR